MSNMIAADSSNRHICLCCKGEAVLAQKTLTSLFLSRTAWGGAPEFTNLLYCQSCGFRTYSRQLSTSEAHCYYSKYRGDSYVTERGRDEVFYNQSAYDRDKKWMESPLRREEMLKVIAGCIADQERLRVLDFGGGDGHLISGMKSSSKAVFDLSCTQALPGIKAISKESELQVAAWDLIVCAQTLEHISTPDITLIQLRDLTAIGGFIYVELPSQSWKSYAGKGAVRDLILALAQKYRFFHQCLDLYSTAFRVKFGVLPPMGFVPMREHVNFFTLDSITQLGCRLGLTVASSQMNPFCGIQVLFKKN